LPRLGIISNPVDGHAFARLTPLAGKDILCLGFSEAQIDEFIAPHGPNSVQTLTLWADHIDAQSNKYPTVIGDITKRTDFADDALDMVITLSVLEHVSSVGDAFDEMARVTRNGGDNLHIFGPAWSCAYGHHLYASETDPNLNFVRWTLPAHMHLLCDRDELRDFYEELGMARDVGDFVWDQFHSTDLINRVFYDDYAELMFDRFQVVHAEMMGNQLPREHLARLRDKFPGRRDFSTYGGLYRLAVNK
jgi:SAM-dependent methyltransferase